MTDGRATTEAPAPPEPPSVPGESGATPGWIRRLALIAVVLATVGILLVWQLGGFELRKDHLAGRPGEAIDAGNLVFTLTDATVQEQKSGTWRVVVSGSVSNPNDEALAPITGDLGNLAVLRSPGTTPATLDSVELGGTWRRDVVAPGGRPVTLAAGFTFPAGSEFAATISCAVVPTEDTDNSVLGVANGATQWNVDSTARNFVVTLPLTVLPPQG